MARINLPPEVRDGIFQEVYARADQFGYMKCDRFQSGQFMDHLVNDLDIGVRLENYMPKERVRTYIKDTILNHYTKHVNSQALASIPPEKAIEETFGEKAAVIDTIPSKGCDLSILRSFDTKKIFVVSSGTTLKWETALRKALEIIASKPNLTINNQVPSICLRLSAANLTLTEADKRAIQAALGAVGVKALFCES